MLALAQAQAAELREKIAAEATSAARTSIEKLEAGLKSRLDSLDRKLKSSDELTVDQFADIECDMIKHEALIWELRKVPSNEFTQYIKLLEKASAREDSNDIDTALRQILRLMDQPLTYSSSTVTNLTELLEKLPSRYSSQVGVLKEALRKKLIANPPL